jgi:spore photoproduct lyase
MAMQKSEAQDLFDLPNGSVALPMDHVPSAPDYFKVETIVLSKGSLATPERERFVHRICDVYPNAKIEWCLDVLHNRVDLNEQDPVALQKKGKKTLLFGELKSAVRFSREEGNTCPNYWHFSAYGYCPYGCRYCYLAGTHGVWFSPTVKIYVNLPEVVSEIDRIANGLKKPTAFYLGKLQDGLALDPLTAYSTVLVPYFARHPYARQVILTKSASVERLLELDHRGHTILSWSLNPPEISKRFEQNVPPIEARILAMQKCAEKGYPIRAVIMPVIPHDDWESLYCDFVRDLLSRIKLERLTFGGICIYPNALSLMERRIGKDNVISQHLGEHRSSRDGRARYVPELRAMFYKRLIAAAYSVQPDLPIALCLEEPPIWQMVGLTDSLGRCNCVL